ncbi:hypothetical protein TELCIR_14329 [Teladorsagia circumcincta]|uniref:Transmembrane protein n=1 Tax=Teladorsagia circumcincta TaxID=45464 RepID=A0A2G9U1H4_TELCI|nr:hypothetical protein TELCIR_14329 [Teladorsagia circumcincta]
MHQKATLPMLILVLALLAATSNSQEPKRRAYSGKELIANASYHGENGYEENNSTKLMSNKSSVENNHSSMTSVGAVSISSGSVFFFVVSSFMIGYYNY